MSDYICFVLFISVFLKYLCAIFKLFQIYLWRVILTSNNLKCLEKMMQMKKDNE